MANERYGEWLTTSRMGKLDTGIGQGCQQIRAIWQVRSVRIDGRVRSEEKEVVAIQVISADHVLFKDWTSPVLP